MHSLICSNNHLLRFCVGLRRFASLFPNRGKPTQSRSRLRLRRCVGCVGYYIPTNQRTTQTDAKP
jgi:hypothetical protein